MGSVAILADDLTGALDTAAPFATDSDPVTVAWRGAALHGVSRVAFDTESRGVSPRAASRRVRSCLPKLAGAAIGFKKLDSLMRGNTLTELAACAASRDFRSVVIAPAFPEQGRVTRCGTQIVARGDGGPLAVDIARALAHRRIAATVVPCGEVPPARGVSICDADTAGDLVRLAAAGPGLEAPVLWCGSAGLARALGRPVGSPVAGLEGRRLVVVGSDHPVAAAQAGRLRERLGSAAVTLERPGDAQAAIRTVGRTLGAGGSSALLFALPPVEPPAAEALMIGTFAALARLDPPDVLVVVGGDTLFRLCTALGAARLEAIGERAPGVPVSRIAGGAWHGVRLVSKSGAFGDREVLVRLLDDAAERARG